MKNLLIFIAFLGCVPKAEETALRADLKEWLYPTKPYKNMQINTIISDQNREVISIVHPAILHGSGWLNHPDIHPVILKLGTYTVTCVGQGYAILTLTAL